MGFFGVLSLIFDTWLKENEKRSREKTGFWHTCLVAPTFGMYNGRGTVLAEET